jgi:hypothetical protein
MEQINILEKYKSLRPISDDKATQEIAEELMQLPDAEMEKYFAGNEYCGAVFIYESRKHPNKVLELVMGTVANDHISTLFEPHPALGNRQAWLDVRKELIRACEKVFSAPEGQLAIKDPARGRHVLTSEFSTAQLLDLIEDSERLVEVAV